VEYSPTGKPLHQFSVLGKSDGLKYDPFDHKLWALRNEDSDPALTLIDPKTQIQTDYTYAAAPAHGGGYDDVVFLNGDIFISASNPTVDAAGQNNFSSIVKAHLSGHKVFVTPVLEGNTPLFDIAAIGPAWESTEGISPQRHREHKAKRCELIRALVVGVSTSAPSGLKHWNS
jgi:hypothetical protein